MSHTVKSAAPTNTSVPPASELAWNAFDRTTSRWGALTMLAALVIMIVGPGIIAVMLGVPPGWVIGGVAIIAVTFGMIWVIEPLSYFPILGPASMYQAFMIGNISNKLLPAAIVAQSAVDARPGTRKGQLAAVLAICGAATTHLLSLLVLVGLFGTVLVSLIPPDVVAVIQAYVLPAIMGAVIVQMATSNPNWTVLGIALVIGALVVFGLPLVAPALSGFAVAIAVVLTIGAALLLPRKTTVDPQDDLTVKEHIA